MRFSRAHPPACHPVRSRTVGPSARRLHVDGERGQPLAIGSTGDADLCAAVAPSGAASDAVTVDGETGTESTATFTAPLEVTELQTTTIVEGTGDPVKAGDLVQFALSAFDGTTGEKLGAQGYNDDLLPVQVSAASGLGQAIGCATTGSRSGHGLPGR